jgi:hypothetical protein
MNLGQKIELISSETELKVYDMVPDYDYNIILAHRIQTVFGNLVQLTIEDSEQKTYVVTLPRQFSVAFSDGDLKKQK